MSPLLLIPLLAVLLGPERDVVPPRMGLPPTDDRVNVIASNGHTFLAGYTADDVSFVAVLDEDGQPDPTMRSSRIGNAVAIASDGDNYLAVVNQAFRSSLILFDRDGAAIREVMRVEPIFEVGSRGVVWTGVDYVVAWWDNSVIRALRVTRDGFLTGAPFEVTTSALGKPYLAVADGEVRLAVVAIEADRTEVHLFRVAGESAAGVEVLRPGHPAIADFIGSKDQFLLLLSESIPGTAVFNVYRLANDDPPRITISSPREQWTQEEVGPGAARLLRLRDGVLLYGSTEKVVVAQRLAWDGSPVSERLAVLDTRVGYSVVRAAANDNSVVFAWTEAFPYPSGSDVVAAGIDADLSSRSDGVPDGVAIARGASSRQPPSVAKSASSTLIVWRERLEGLAWIAGALDGRGIIISAPSAFLGDPDVASDGQGFLVTWTAPTHPTQTDWSRIAVFARTVDAQGTMGDILEIPADDAVGARVAGNRGGYVIVWEDPDHTPPFQRYGSRILASRVDSAGRRLDATPVTAAGPAAAEPAIASDGERFLIAWTSGYCVSRFGGCSYQTSFNLKARIFDASLQPVTSEFSISDDPSIGEVDASVASSGDGWLVAWTVWQSDYADIGYANISAEGFVGAAYRPMPASDRRTHAAVAWMGTRYEIVSLFNYRVEDIPGATYPALASGILVYTRRAPERGLGAAPQVFTREVLDTNVRRRAAAR